MIFGKNKKVLTKYNQTNKTNNILKNRESRKLPEFQPFPEACVAERGPQPLLNPVHLSRKRTMRRTRSDRAAATCGSAAYMPGTDVAAL